MDEELKKRNTDCVYFLASPLTCKKGIECEYRHSETARLNPRDCWYWLAGSCLNPSCAFRHPPLDVHSAVSSEPAPPQNQSPAPVNKLKVPCYYYFNGFCNKGDRCSFLHEPDEDGPPAWKSSKTASAVIGASPFENKTSAVSDAGSAPIETLPNPSEAASQRAAELQINSKPDLYPSAHNNVKDPSVYPHMSASEGEEAAAIGIDTLHPGRDLIQSRSLVCTDQSSEEELVDGELEREDWLESSPGFDVLVDDDRSENNLGYEEDPEYLIAIDRDGRELNGHFAGYDYEDPVEDDPRYPDARMFYEQERCDSFDLFDNGERIEYIRKVHERSRVKMLDPILPRKRKFLPMTLVTDEPRRMDLRNHLKKRRVIDGRLVTCFSRRNNSSLLVDRRRERPRKLGTPRLLGRLNSEVHNNRVGSLSRNGNLVHPNRPRQRYVEKRLSKQNFLSSQVSPKPVSRKRSSTVEPSTVFSGPKTLAQIKEEKRKFTENGDSSGRPGNSSRTTAEEFQGPKPLSEILKGRKKLGSVINVNNDSS